MSQVVRLRGGSSAPAAAPSEPTGPTVPITFEVYFLSTVTFLNAEN